MNQILVYQIIVLLIISVLSAVFAGVDGFWSSLKYRIYQPFVKIGVS